MEIITFKNMTLKEFSEASFSTLVIKINQANGSVIDMPGDNWMEYKDCYVMSFRAVCQTKSWGDTVSVYSAIEVKIYDKCFTDAIRKAINQSLIKDAKDKEV